MMQDPHPPSVKATTKRGLSRTEVADYIGIGTTHFDKMVLAGQMPHPKRIGIRKIWDKVQVDAAFERLPSDNPNSVNVDEDANDWD